MNTEETCPCGLCGKPTRMTGTKRCDGCWELEMRVNADPVLARQILGALSPVVAPVTTSDAERAAFETHYAKIWKERTSKRESLEELRAVLVTMRDDEGYNNGAGGRPAFINNLWEGWQAHAALPIDFKQATELLAMFGGEPGEVTLLTGEGHSGRGLYAHYSEYPEEGAEFLGVADDEAVPGKQATDQGGWLSDEEVARRVRCAFASTNNTPHTGLYQHWYEKGLREGAQISSAAPTLQGVADGDAA